MKISNYILNELIKYNLIKKEYSIDSYYYGIITGLTLLLNFISSLFICFTLGKTKEFFVFFIFLFLYVLFPVVYIYILEKPVLSFRL